MKFLFHCLHILLVTQIISVPGHAQRFYSRNYTVNDGLPANSVHAIFRDSRGIMWIGTEGGLCRFDGDQFRVYTTLQGLSGNDILSITEDNNGDLWIYQATGGVSRFDGKKFHRYATSPDSERTGAFPKKELPPEYTDRIIRAGISPDEVISSFFDVLTGHLWIGTKQHGLFRIPEPAFAFYDASYFGLKSLRVNDLYFDRKGTLWVAAGKAVIRKPPTGPAIILDTAILERSQEQAYIRYVNAVAPVFLDKDGSYEKYRQMSLDGKFDYLNPYVEINTEFGGTTIKSPGSQYDTVRYRLLIKSVRVPTLQHSSQYSCLGSDSKGNIYLSNNSYLHRFNADNDYRYAGAVHSGPLMGVFAITPHDTLASGDIWIKGLFVAALNPRVHFPVRFYYGWHEENGPPSVISMILRGDEIWCGSRTEGLFRVVNGKSDAFNLKDTTLPRIIPALCTDHQGNIIAGGINGTIIIATTEGDDLKVLHRITPQKGLVGTTIGWLITRNNHLYAGTNQGLNVIDLGLLYRTGELHIQFYNEDEGFSDYSGTTAELGSDGNIWVGTRSGLIWIDPARFAGKSTKISTFQISRIEVSNAPYQFPVVHTRNTWNTTPVAGWKFKHDQNMITFYLEVADYTTSAHNQFRYVLKGMNKDWSRFSADNKAVFTNLDPGNYVFVAECRNLSDNLMISQIEYPFSIMRPWYDTWWFFLLVGFLVISTGTGLFYLRVRVIRRRERSRNKLLLDISKMEMRALQAQMKPHFIFNAINSMQSYILNNETRRALFYLNIFSKLIRKTMENAAKEFIPVVEELDYLTYYIEIEKMRFEGLFDHQMIIAPDVPLETAMIPPMIVQLFVENSIKHGLTHRKDGGLLIIELTKQEPGLFRLTVQDNGVGRDQSKKLEQGNLREHKSHGLHIISERIRILNETYHTNAFRITLTDLENQDGSPAGVRVEFFFPDNIK